MEKQKTESREELVKSCKFHERLFKNHWTTTRGLYKLLHEETKKFYIMKDIKQDNFSQNAVILIKQPILNLVGARKFKPGDNTINIVDITLDNAHTYMYFLYEDCTGIPLPDFIRTRKSAKLHENDIRTIIKGLLDSIKAYHRDGIIHSDIKPLNIFIEGNEKLVISAKLTDIFTARIPSLDFQQLLTAIEEPAYCAPEILKGNQLNKTVKVWNLTPADLSKECGMVIKSDIWSIGIIAYELSQGKTPFGQKIEEILGSISYGIYKANNIDGNLADFIAQCLQTDPNKRPSCEELLNHPFITTDCELFENVPDVNDVYTFNCTDYKPFIKPELLKAKSENVDNFIPGDYSDSEASFSVLIRDAMLVPSASQQIQPSLARSVSESPASQKSQQPANITVLPHNIIEDVNKISAFLPNTIYSLEYPDKLLFVNLAQNKKCLFKLPFKIGSFVGTAFENNIFYISGGYSNGSYTKQMRGFEINQELITFKEILKLKSMNIERVNHQMLAIHEFGIICIGGMNYDSKISKLVCLNNTEIYSIKSNEWFNIGNMNFKRSLPGICLCGQKTVCVFGGWNHEQKYLDSIELCQISAPHSMKWELVIPKGITAKICSPAIIQTGPGDLLIFGGNTQSGNSQRVYKLAFNIASQTCSWSDWGAFNEKDAFANGSFTKFKEGIYAIGFGSKKLYTYSVERRNFIWQHKKIWLNQNNQD